MSSQLFKEVALNEITPNPLNPRKNFSGPKFDELVASIKAKGVLEPVLVRSNPSGPGYELVAGERRFRASCRIAESNGGLSAHTIPAMVRELSDDDAFDVMCIENLQREDLTELEEAESFKMFVDKHGSDSVPQLAERTGIDPKYIRRRLAVLKLPKKALKAWDKGEVKYGHLEQLLRIEDKKIIGEYVDKIINYRGAYSVRELKDDIDDDVIDLKDAKFDKEKAGCYKCAKNSLTQKNLFDVGDLKGEFCLDSKCFKQTFVNYLQANWKKSGYRKQHQTNGFRFQDAVNWQDRHEFVGGKKPRKECKECPLFITLLYMDGRVHSGKVCIGDISCFNKKKKEDSKPGTNEKVTKQPPAWHGEFFREKFYQEQLPLRLKEVPIDDEKTAQVMLFSLLKSNHALRQWYGVKRCGRTTDESYWQTPDNVEIWNKIIDCPYTMVKEDLKEAAIEVVMQEQNLGGYAGAEMAKSRHLIADHIGISLQEEWRITEEYLQKKTKPEIFAIAEKYKLFEDPRAQTFLFETLMKKRGSFNSCKKPELMRVILESGVDLAGVVPDEILEVR